MRVFSHDLHTYPLPDGHRFPLDKYRLVRESAEHLEGVQLTAAEAAQFLKVTVSWVYEHVRPEAEDRLPFLKLGKYLRFDVRDLRIYIDGKRHAARHSRRRR